MNIEINQIQTIKSQLSVQLQKSLELLQFTSLELYSYIKDQEMENPLIELRENTNEKFIISNNTKALENVSYKNNNFQDNIWRVVKLSKLSPREKKILKFIIYNLDNKGFLDFKDNYNNEEINNGILLLQRYGPSGIGARDIKESLYLQLRERYPNERVTISIILNYFEEFKAKNWSRISKALNISYEEIEKSYTIIKSLNLFPLSNHSHEETEFLFPDILVEFTLQNKCLVTLNDTFLPTIHVNKEYLELLPSSHYIAQQYNLYKQLIYNIKKRMN